MAAEKTAERSYDVLCVGNAIVDMSAQTDDAFLSENGIEKGTMSLIDTERASELYRAMGPTMEMSGGSAANTAAGIAALGGKVAYIGKVADDQIGAIFTHDIRALGADFDTAPLSGGDPTARCMVFVTPDGERSMSTYLGCAARLTTADMDRAKIEGSEIVYFEGYLWDLPDAKDAIRMAAKLAHDQGRRTAITLSDRFCVERYREEFLELIETGTVDIVFANEDEARALYLDAPLEECAEKLRASCPLAVVTRSAKGSLVVAGKETYQVEAMEIEKLVDTTGAGDLFAAGFLFGHVRSMPLDACARLGSFCAGTIIQQMGPRPTADLKDEAGKRGLI